MAETARGNVRSEKEGPLAWITVDRPERLNALDRSTVGEIRSAVEEAVADAEVRAIALTGSGEKAFVAGADIAEMASLSAAEGQAFSRFLAGALGTIERSPKPVIAAVNGFALGGGCELAMACHLRIAAENAKFGQPEVGLGLIAGAGGTQRLPRIVGRGRALALLLTGDRIDAREAERIGLVHKVVEPARLHEEVRTIAATIASRGPLALARTLEAVLSGGELPLDEALRLEAALFGLCFATDEMREGTSAFLEKRSPRFEGR